MPAKRTSRNAKARDHSIGQLLNKAGDGATVETFVAHETASVPKQDIAELNAAIEKARLVIEGNYWLKNYFKLKRSIFNFGLQVNPFVEAKKKKSASKKKDTELDKLNEWLDTEVPVLKTAGTAGTPDNAVGVPGKVFKTNRERVMKFVREAWDEFLMLECCIAYWSDSLDYAVTLPPERCRYKDILGIETLFYRHGLGAQELKLLPPDVQERFKTAEILVSEADGDFFKVVKTARTGFGIGLPSIQSIFRVAATLDSMQVGEHAYAYAGKMKFRHWKIGHEIKQGPMAGKATHFWTAKMATALRGVFENKVGFLGDYTSRHDFALEYPHEKVEYFDEDKWKSPEHQLIQWGGPVASMLIASGVTPFLAQLLRAEVEEARNVMKEFLESVVFAAFAPPVPIELSWSNTVFLETSVLIDVLKTGLAGGAISQSTWRSIAGFDDAKEAQKKIEEAEARKTNPEQFEPAFDASHGTAEAMAAKANGKPGGKKDKDNAQTQ